MQLTWMKCGDDAHWCDFNKLDTNNLDYLGVYMIFYLGKPGRVVYVGQGNIGKRISDHRRNPEITKYSGKGLLVTWAKVDRQYLDGIERFLADTWNPLVGEAHPAVQPIQVNSPF